MKLRWHKAAALVLAALLFSSNAFATPYFSSSMVNPELLTPPLAPQSAEWNADIEQILKIQQKPDEAQLKQAIDEQKMSPEMVVLAVDPSLTREAYPRMYEILDRVGETGGAIMADAKKFWNTTRPYAADPRVKALGDKPGNAAYPSGHTSGAYPWAYVMGELIPAKRAAFMARAEAIAQHRVLLGVHWPHDLKGGKELSLLMMGGLLQTARFQKDFANAKNELSKNQPVASNP